MTEEIHIPCPQCQSVLRLPDRKLLGRKGKCPKCKTSFLLEEPNSASTSVKESSHDVSSRPGWMGSESDSATKLVPPPLKSKQPRKSKRKKTDTSKRVKASTPAPEIQNEQQSGFVGLNSLNTSSSSNSGVGKMHELKLRQKKQTKFFIIVGGVLAVLVFGITLFVMQKQATYEKTREAAKKPKVDEQWQEEKKQLSKNTEDAKLISPTSGKPIMLSYLPAGCRLLINVHPAFFWEENSKGQEFRYCFGENVNNWLSTTMRELCKYEPHEIDEVLFGVVLYGQGSAPEYATVVHLKEKQNREKMIQKFEAELSPDFKNYKVYVKGERAFIIIDQQTFVSSPLELINETIEVLADPNITNTVTTGIEELLKQTDRDRHFTILFETSDAIIHKKTLVPDTVQPAWDEFLIWLGKDVETMSWSWHLGEEEFHSEILLRNQMVRSPALLNKDFQDKINHLPYMVLGAIEKMNPTTSGPRKIIGRLPAMLKAFSIATSGGTGKRHLQLITRLSERAAPNLAIGTVLAWDESTRTDFNKKPTGTKPTTPTVKLPTTVIGRLRMKIDVDFRNTPLQEAFAYLAEETKTEIIVDGDALKLSGFTKNMPQTFAMEKVPATHVIAKILSQRGYDLMRVVVDEKSKKVFLTTKAASEDQKLTPYDFAAEIKKK